MLLYLHSFSHSLGFNGTFDLTRLLLWSRSTCMWPCIRAKLRWRSLTLIKPEVSLYSHERVLLFTCNFSFFIWTKQTEVAERMGDKRPLLWQRHRETPLGGSKHRRTLYSASQGGRKTTVAWQHSRASQGQTAQAREQQKLSCLQAGIKWSNRHQGVSD